MDIIIYIYMYMYAHTDIHTLSIMVAPSTGVLIVMGE